MNNLSLLRKNNSVSKERLQIRNYLISSVVFTIFALVCSHSVVKSIDNPRLAHTLQNRLSTFHIIALHVIGVSTLVIGTFSNQDE